MLKSVIFDFDGTIADTFSIAIEAIESIADRDGFEIPEELELEGDLDVPVSEILKMLPFSKVKIPFYVKEIRQMMLENYDRIGLFDGMDEVLKELSKEYDMGLVTSNGPELVEKFLEDNGIDVFDEVNAGLNLFGKKGKIRKTLKSMGSCPEEAVFTGDDERDIEACRADGIPIISVTWGYQSRDVIETAAPDYIADSPEEILRIVRAIS